jgi:cell division septal protein FtsQ
MKNGRNSKQRDRARKYTRNNNNTSSRSNYRIFKLQFRKKIRFFLKKLFVIFPVLFVFFIIFIYVFNKNFIEKVHGTIGTTYYKYAYNKFCYNINVEGTVNSNSEYILSIINKYCADSIKNEINYKSYKNYIFPLIQIKNEIKTIPWVKDVTVQRKLPYTVSVTIDEYMPFALWRDDNNDKLKLIDEKGRVININNDEIQNFYNLIIISGENSKENITSLFNLLSINAELSSRIDYANWIGDRRWDVLMDNDTLVKLPESGVVDAWSKFIELYRIPGLFIDLKVLDLRISDRVFLEYNNGTAKEIKGL